MLRLEFTASHSDVTLATSYELAQLLKRTAVIFLPVIASLAVIAVPAVVSFYKPWILFLEVGSFQGYSEVGRPDSFVPDNF